jgi:hypothetical protein
VAVRAGTVTGSAVATLIDGTFILVDGSRIRNRTWSESGNLNVEAESDNHNSLNLNLTWQRWSKTSKNGGGRHDGL